MPKRTEKKNFENALRKVDDLRLKANVSDISAKNTKGSYGRKMSRLRADDRMKEARKELNRNTGPLTYENLKKLDKTKKRLDNYEAKRNEKPKPKTVRTPSGHRRKDK